MYMKEIWKDIKGYEGLYQVSNKGRVKSLDRVVKNGIKYNHIKQHVMKTRINGRGYIAVMLCKNGVRKMIAVHRLVAEAFIQNPDNKPVVDHINTIRTDNRVENLRWCTIKENCNNELTRKKLSGDCHPMKGKHHSEEAKQKISIGNKGNRNPNYRKFDYDHHSSKIVLMFTKCGDFIREFGSLMGAFRETGIAPQSISLCCSGKRKTAGGYVWRLKYE